MCLASPWQRRSAARARERSCESVGSYLSVAGIRLRCVTCGIQRGCTRLRLRSLSRIRTSSWGCIDQAIQLKPSRGFNNIHTRARELEILNIPKLPVGARRGALVEGP